MTRAAAVALVLAAGACKRESSPNDVPSAASGDAAERAVSVTPAEVAALAPGLQLPADAGTLRKERTQGRVEVAFEYATGALNLASSLNVEASAEQGDRLFWNTAEALAEATHQNGLERRACTPSPALTRVLAWGQHGVCSVVTKDSEALGLSLAIQRDQRVYLLSLFAPELGRLEPQVIALVSQKLDAMAAYPP